MRDGDDLVDAHPYPSFFARRRNEMLRNQNSSPSDRFFESKLTFSSSPASLVRSVSMNVIPPRKHQALHPQTPSPRLKRETKILGHEIETPTPVAPSAPVAVEVIEVQNAILGNAGFENPSSFFQPQVAPIDSLEYDMPTAAPAA